MRDQHLASDKGLLTELKFEVECFQRGYHISKPLHPKSVYDFIIDIEGKLLKIQVKYTSCRTPSGNFRLTCAKGSTSKKSSRKNYTENDIDYMVGLTSDNDWYIIPMSASVTTCITLTDKYEPYRNNWRFE